MTIMSEGVSAPMSMLQTWMDANPGKTEADFWAAMRGPAGDDFLKQWRAANNQPNATMADVAAALKGAKGDSIKGDKGDKGDSVKGDQGPPGIIPIYLNGTLQQNVQRHSYDVTTDASGNWTVDCSAAKFTKITTVVGTAWKDVDAATDQVDIRFKAMTTTKVTGSAVKGARVTTLLVSAGQDTVAKVPSVPVRVTIEGPVQA